MLTLKKTKSKIILNFQDLIPGSYFMFKNQSEEPLSKKPGDFDVWVKLSKGKIRRFSSEREVRYRGNSLVINLGRDAAEIWMN